MGKVSEKGRKGDILLFCTTFLYTHKLPVVGDIRPSIAVVNDDE